MKPFNPILQQQQQQPILNPYIFTTPEVQRQIQMGIMSKVSKLIIGTGLATILTAPVQTIVTSMQLSVLKHKDMFVSVEARTKELARMNTELTVAEKRRVELMIRSGGEFQPYVAPVYQGYQQAIRNLAKQGWTSFFKGLTFRLCHSMPHFFCYTALFKDLTEAKPENYGFFSFVAKCYGFLFLTDLSLNIFQVLQNRYVLQNNIKQFRVFRNVIRVMSKMITRGEVFKGVSYHGINSLFELILKFPALLILFTSQKFTTATALMYYASQALTYPFQTAYKRFICQSSVIPGMIPTRYSSVGHALKVIAFEQKFLGLYKGFGLHSVGVGARLLILQALFRNVEIVQTSQF